MKLLFALLMLISNAYSHNLTIGYAPVTASMNSSQISEDIDIDMVKQIMEKSSLHAQFIPLNTPAQIEEFNRATHKILIGTPNTTMVNGKQKYSIPYRYSHPSIFFLHDIPANPKIGMLDSSYEADFLSKTIEYDVATYPLLPRMVEDLQKGKIDAFIADQVAGGSYVWNMGLSYVVHYKHLEQKVPVVLVFAQDIPDNVVSIINNSIQSLEPVFNDKRVYQKYYQPILLAHTVNQHWFFVIDIIGTIAFAISGVIVAYHCRMNLFAAFFMALLPATGGGIIRDLIVDRRPIFIVANRYYLYAIILTVLCSLLYLRFFSTRCKKMHPRMHLVLELFDAFGLATFSVIGVWVAFMKNIQPLCLWGPVLAVLTSCGGGIVRDLFRSDRHFFALYSNFYAEISLAWSSILTAFLLMQHDSLTHDQAFWAVIITIAGAFFTRMCVVMREWKNYSLHAWAK